MTAVATERRRLSLRVLIFMLCAGLVVLVVMASVGMSIYQGRSVAETAIDQALARSQATQDDFQALRNRQLELITELVAGDAQLRVYIGEALGGGDDLFGGSSDAVADLTSVADLLEERRQRIGFDVAMLLDPYGLLLTHSLRPVGVDEDLTAVPLVAELVEQGLPQSGLWLEGGELYQAALVPLTERQSLIGFLIAGLRVDASLMNEIKSASGTELVLLARDGVYASTLAARETDELVRALPVDAALVDSVLAAGGLPSNRTVDIGGRPWVASLRPFDLGSDVPVVAVSLISRDAVLAGYRTLQRSMIAVGAIMIGVGLLGSLLLARRVTGPLERLTRAATQASEGDYDQRFGVAGGDEIGRLGQAFDSLLSDLRERRDMEEFVSDLSRFLPEPGSEAAQSRSDTTQSRAPEHRQAALLGLDFRAATFSGDDARSHIAEIEHRLGRVEACALRCGGRIEAVMGHRVLLSFDGEDGALEALACAGELSRADLQLPPMALVSGEIDRGSVRAGTLRAGVVLGKPSQQLDLLLEEAKPGQLLLSPPVKAALEEAIEEPRAQVIAGRLSGRRYYGLGPGQLTVLPSPEDEQPTVDTGHLDSRALAQGQAAAGDVFADRYEIVSILGAGGMGVVYKALDRELDDYVALKTLLPEIASDTHYLESLKEELKLARRITHANVLRTFDFGSFEGTAYISMEYVRGMTLRYLLRQRPQLPYSAGLRIARQLCAALAAAHEQGVIHRDVKPENLILEAAGNAKLMDFGIARPVAKLATDEAQSVFQGTPRYASPEQMEGKPVDASADVFACGVLMYEMFVGVAPYAGNDLMAIYEAKRDRSVLPPSGLWEGIPPELETIILTCLEPDSGDRYATARQLGAALSRLRS